MSNAGISLIWTFRGEKLNSMQVQGKLAEEFHVSKSGNLHFTYVGLTLPPRSLENVELAGEVRNAYTVLFGDCQAFGRYDLSRNGS
jgi:hypothetical protein